MSGKKVVVGLSGGVDSSVAAALLIDQGYEVHGVYLECYNEPGCRTDQDKADALKVALKLNIPFEVIDFRTEYKDKVVDYFYSEYEAGRTPNPDVMCNKEIKFGIFYNWAMAKGYDYIATGHYCRIASRETPGSRVPGVSRKVLQRARDESKDQSYFLWQVPREHLAHVLFPLGDMFKSEVREMARVKNLHTASKPDSMGICFIGEVNVSHLLNKKLGENPGKVVLNGEVIGDHNGLWFYTIGERRGFSVNKKQLQKMGFHSDQMEPLYVIGKDVRKNELIVGLRGATMTKEIRVKEMTIDESLGGKKFLRIRNLGELVPIESIEDSLIVTKSKIFGVAEGQSAVIYDESGRVLGGGIIAQ